MPLGTNYSFYCLGCCQYSRILVTSYRKDCLMCCPSNKFIKSGTRHLTSNGTDQCQNGSSNLLLSTPYREQTRSTQIVVTYPRLAFSATKRTHYAPKRLFNKPKFFTATRHADIRKIELPRSMGVEALSC